MRLHASAPTRIDLAGGTLDIWPLYLFHPGALTLNLAISRLARCLLEPRADRRIVLINRDTGRREAFASLRALQKQGRYRLPLPAHMVRFFAPSRGLTLTTWSEVPAGSGLGGSSALAVAIGAAFSRWLGRRLSRQELVFLGRDTDARVLGVPTGEQDHYPAAFGGVGVVVAAWPFVHQMNPSADVLALASIEVDIGDVEPGTQLTVKWRGKPVFIRRRTADEIAAARAVPLDDLKDQGAENRNLDRDADASDQNRTLDEAGEWLVMIGVCTHLGCVPLGNGAGDFGGWFCPCHGSHYDTAGRIRKGPAPKNLEVPKMALVSDTVIKLG